MGLISNGTTIFDNGSMASGFGADLKFISKATASASASIEFTSGIDSTYKEYIFYFVNIHPQTDAVNFQFNLSTDGGSNYNVAKTTTIFLARHFESDANIEFTYDGGSDLAQGTGFQLLIGGSSVGADNDQHISGSLTLYNPSSTTFVKHFISTTQTATNNDNSNNSFIAGYGNTVNPIDAVKFEMNTGNIDAGEILLFGIN